MILGVLVCFAVVGLGCTSSGSGLPAILAIVSPQPIPHFFKSQQIALPFLFSLLFRFPPAAAFVLAVATRLSVVSALAALVLDVVTRHSDGFSLV